MHGCNSGRQGQDDMSVLRREILKAWHKFRDSYRPELHYMRGPGPRTLERERSRQTASRSQDRSTDVSAKRNLASTAPALSGHKA